MINNPLFEDFITEKPLYYKEIDHTRIAKAYGLLKPHIRHPLTIHIVGTNGKGSTGRIMATLLHESKKRVGHFSSPHILKFNERIWLEGRDSSDEELEKAHKRLYSILGREMSDALSYFEYTTLLAFVAMEDLDVMILEAGLGGEFDATNVCSKALSVITPIGLDHQDFLGDTVESIARTKLNSIESKVIVGLQVYDEVYNIADEISSNKKARIYKVEKDIDRELFFITESLFWADYLYENAKLAIEALKIVNLPYQLNDLKKVTLFGRFYSLFPNVIIDVGHNLLAAKRVVHALEQKYTHKKPILIYNSLDDKDYRSILLEYKKIVKHIEIIKIETQRAVNMEDINLTLKRIGIEAKKFHILNDDEEYIVFGSFYVVEAFLKQIKNDLINK